MIDLSNCTIAKVKTFMGLRSIDPPVPIDEFLEDNFNNLKSLIEKNQIIVIDDRGNEVDSVVWEDYIIDFYENHDGFGNLDEDEELLEDEQEDDELLKDDEFFESNTKEEYASEEEIQEELELINIIDNQEKAKIAHKNRLIKSLEHCDESAKLILEKGIEHADQKIKELQSERKSVLIRINQKIKD